MTRKANHGALRFAVLTCEKYNRNLIVSFTQRAFGIIPRICAIGAVLHDICAVKRYPLGVTYAENTHRRFQPLVCKDYAVRNQSIDNILERRVGICAYLGVIGNRYALVGMIHRKHHIVRRDSRVFKNSFCHRIVHIIGKFARIYIRKRNYRAAAFDNGTAHIERIKYILSHMIYKIPCKIAPERRRNVFFVKCCFHFLSFLFYVADKLVNTFGIWFQTVLIPCKQSHSAISSCRNTRAQFG